MKKYRKGLKGSWRRRLRGLLKREMPFGQMEKLRAEILKKPVEKDATPKHTSQQASCHSDGGVAVDIGVKNKDTP